MKIDRLLGMLIYLLNRDTVSARELAERFEVSMRTVQRDMETLGLSGIPVASILGTAGGYRILDTYKLSRQLFTAEDYLQLIIALRGLDSAYQSREVGAALEKMLSLTPDGMAAEQRLQLDLSVLREGLEAGDRLAVLDAAIRRGKAVCFDYTNAQLASTRRLVEPVQLTYKWYAWYLLGYCCEKQAYRLFRLSRIRNLAVTGESVSRDHRQAEQQWAEAEKERPYVQMKLAFAPELRILVEESFPFARISGSAEGSTLLAELSLPENERGWFGVLLELGGRVTVLEPEAVRQELLSRARDIVNLYRSGE
jgi:predicted DNA-binding transcriptional regulator YafY